MSYRVLLKQILWLLLKQKLTPAWISSYRDLHEMLTTKSELAW